MKKILTNNENSSLLAGLALVIASTKLLATWNWKKMTNF